jgi:hypothetical protein
LVLNTWGNLKLRSIRTKLPGAVGVKVEGNLEMYASGFGLKVRLAKSAVLLITVPV